MEGYKGNDATCTKAVQSFVSAWHSELHAQGYVSGVYGSAASTMRDVAALGSAKPDNAWIANWNGVENVFGDPYVSDALWPNHQRVHQYKGGHKETYGGATINIDSDYVDGAVVGGSAAVPPPPPPAEPPAGSVGSGDGKATATWVAGSFDTTAVVTLTPTTAPPVADGVRRPADGHRSGDVDRRGALRRTGDRPPADADRRARAVVVGRRRCLEAVAQAVVGSVAGGCRRGLHARPGRDDRDPDARARLLRPAARHDAAVTGADDGALRQGRAAPRVAGARRTTRATSRTTRCCSTGPPCRRCPRRRGV